jgi:hypothetical protein
MANRVLLGQRGSQYGLYVSRSGSDVLTCPDDELIFSTDSADQVDHVIVLEEITSTNQAAGTTVNNSTSVTTATGETSFALVEGTDTLTTSFTSGSTFSTTLDSSYSNPDGSGTVNVEDQTIKVFLFKGIPSTSLF